MAYDGGHGNAVGHVDGVHAFITHAALLAAAAHQGSPASVQRCGVISVDRLGIQVHRSDVALGIGRVGAVAVSGFTLV